MSSINSISISQLLDSLKYFGELILKIFLLYILVRISTALIVWFWRTLIVPIFRKRAYFYYYQNDGFYSEERPLGLFRRIRNARWTINDKLVGYVERNRGDFDEAFDHVIYLKSHGRSPVGGAIFEDGVCKIYLIKHDMEGGLDPELDKPVGFITVPEESKKEKGGKIYKYYADRESWLKDIPLETPEFIGDCECPGKDWFGKKKWPTGGQKPDEDVLPYITEERDDSELREGFKDSWPYFRKNCYRRKKVRTKQMNSGTSVSDGKIFYAMLSSKLWRFLHVYPTGWDNKAMAWGYGYCTEDWRNPFKRNDDKGAPMICRAAAALLLARYEGFVLAPDEIPQKEKKGPIPTVLLSYLLYLALYIPLFQSIADHFVFKFLGVELNKTVILIGLFFVLWLLIVHPIRCLLRERTDTLEAFLDKLNTNIGVTGWMVLLVIVSVLGIVLSVFVIDYNYFPIYLCALVTIVLNWSVYNARRWPIEGYGRTTGGQRKKGDFHEDNATEGRRKNQDRMERTNKDNADGKKGLKGLGKDEDQENGEEKPQDAYLNTPTRHLHFYEKLYFDKDKLLNLRLQNPFRTPWWTNGDSYQKVAAGMVGKEVNADGTEGSIYSKVSRMAAFINAFAAQHSLSSVEKVQLIMALSQPENIKYQYDDLSGELWIEGHNNGQIIEGGGAFKEYCRFPSETLYDKRGDCDCHAALAGALFAACGYGCCYLVGKTNLGSHAALGLEITDDLNSLKQFKEAVFPKADKEYLYVETAGHCMIGHVPAGFEEMLQGEYYPIEPKV